MTEAGTPLVVALGRTPRTEALFTGAVSAPALPLELPAIPSIIGAFPAMVREGRWPV
ncbi:hypothetical protein [Sabulicella glaciei]|uniref:Uncharacterized protein n=1 Tax=Sabulicella glaciei TaxID=2984948 RepID=A0ABT3P0X3_9PROT|nr:hypothetical protein [Roseococcus sp. MDT2-1-1]MCW8087833.1 hypothetical protein [Roseococcus sp. MDT2-1-1]